MHSSSPVRTPKLQLSAEQPSTGECWIPPQKDTPHPRTKEKPQQESQRGEAAFRIKPHTCQRHSEGSNKPCAPQDPETPQRLSQNCVRMSPVEVWVSSGLLQGHGLWVQQTWVWYKPSWRRLPLTLPIELPELPQDWGDRLLEGTNKTCAHQDPGERNSDLTRD